MSALMRRTLFGPVLSALLLLACGPSAPGDGAVAPDVIAVTPLGAPGAGPVADQPAPDQPAPDQPAPHPKPRPETLPQAATPDVTSEAVAPEAVEPEAPKTAEQLLCEKVKGQWLSAGDTGAFYCASLTRDSGKQCRKKGDCQGQCLARSGTCSPIMPLYGCNDILEKDGRRVTLCIN